jgi:hypothetical protein
MVLEVPYAKMAKLNLIPSRTMIKKVLTSAAAAFIAVAMVVVSPQPSKAQVYYGSYGIYQTYYAPSYGYYGPSYGYPRWYAPSYGYPYVYRPYYSGYVGYGFPAYYGTYPRYGYYPQYYGWR